MQMLTGLKTPWRGLSAIIVRHFSKTSQDVGRLVEPGHAYFVATPLGNKLDISARSIQILNDVDVICAEDTRKTEHLLRTLGIPSKRIISHHQHNEAQSAVGIIKLVEQRNSVAVVSDAGTPGISDPGVLLARELVAAGVPLHPIPGPSAVTCALSVSGFCATPFTFMGFMAVKGKERNEAIQSITATPHTVVLFEAPHRVLRTFDDFILADESMASRDCVCCREITKTYEDIRRGTVSEIRNWLQSLDEDKEIGIRGEFTIVLGPQVKRRWADVRNNLKSGDQLEGAAESEIEMVSEALRACKDRGLRRAAAVKEVSVQLKTPKSIVYDIALKIPWE